MIPVAGPDLHAPAPGQTQALCEHYQLWQRATIEMQARLIVDLHRRLAGEPLVTVHCNGTRELDRYVT